MVMLLLRPAEGLTAIGEIEGRSTSRAADLSDATGGGVYGRAFSHRGRPEAIRRILQNGLRWRNCEHGRRKRTSVHQKACYKLWKSRGAEFLTEPLDKYGETRCYIRDPDGYIIEVGQSETGFKYG